MPDWVTHIGVVYLLFYLLSKGLDIDYRYLPILLFGAILPDIGKVFLIMNQFLGVTEFSLPFGTPFGAALLALTISSFFTNPKKVFPFLFAGSMVHLFLDSLMFPWGGAEIEWFYPVSMKAFSAGFFWPDYLRPMLLTVAAVAMFLLVDRFR